MNRPTFGLPERLLIELYFLMTLLDFHLRQYVAAAGGPSVAVGTRRETYNPSSRMQE